MTIGESIKRVRIQKGMTQKQLGELLGVSLQTVSAYESGRRRPKMETLGRFADALGVSFLELTKDVDYLPNEEAPGNGFVPALSALKMRVIAEQWQKVLQNGTEEEKQAVREQLEKEKSDMQDAALLSVFHTLSDMNKQRAIAYCEGLAAQQPDYEFLDTVPPQEKKNPPAPGRDADGEK